MTDPATTETDTGMFTVGQPSEYLPGHIVLGVVLAIEFLVPSAIMYAT